MYHCIQACTFKLMIYLVHWIRIYVQLQLKLIRYYFVKALSDTFPYLYRIFPGSAQDHEQILAAAVLCKCVPASKSFLIT